MATSRDVEVRFEAGRGTVLRMADLGVRPRDLSVPVPTHVHGAHVVDVVDVAMTRPLEDRSAPRGPLPVVTARGGAEPFLEALSAPFVRDTALRFGLIREPAADLAVSTCSPSSSPQVVWSGPNGEITVRAFAVHHVPVDASAHRIDAPDGSVADSGGTRLGDEEDDRVPPPPPSARLP